MLAVFERFMIVFHHVNLLQNKQSLRKDTPYFSAAANKWHKAQENYRVLCF